MATDSHPLTLLLPCLPLKSKWLFNWTQQGPTTLSGFQIFAVEQRIIDRSSIMPCIVVFTGNTSDTIEVEQWSVTSGEDVDEAWEEATRLMKGEGCRIQAIERGYIPVTALPSLSQDLSIVRLPSGGYAPFAQLYLAINLRRLGFGGRSGISLDDPTQAQQLQLSQTFLIPTSFPSTSLSTSIFAEKVLKLISLVQNGLSLFGLGPVSVKSFEGSAGESQLEQGDGLLCHSTLAALELFRVDIAEPLLRLSPDDSPLSSSLFACLLSLVISSRGKLTVLGQNHVPSDPFERRSKFLSACRHFQSANNISPVSPYLSYSFLSTLTTLFATSSTSKVSRALRTRLDVSLKDSHRSRARGENCETSKLSDLVKDLENDGIGGNTVSELYGMKPTSHGSKSQRRADAKADSEVTERTTSDTESQSFGRNVLSGARVRAGRISRKLGDNLGFSDHGASPEQVTSKRFQVTPTVVISSDQEDESNPDDHLSRTTSILSAIVPNLSNLPRLLPGAHLMSSHSASTSSTSLGLGPSPASVRRVARRAASERPGSTAFKVSTQDGDPLASDRESAWKTFPVVSTRRIRRRHSFDAVYDAPEPFQILSRKRLEMDVQLRMAAWNLKQRERKLAVLGDALQIIHTSYSEALASLTTPCADRQTLLASLTTSAQSLSAIVDSYSSSTSPISKLSTGSSRLVYSLSVLQDKLTDVNEFQRMMVSKIGEGGQGTLELGTKELSQRQSGMRRLVGTLEMWGRWTNHLCDRMRVHVNRSLPKDDAIAIENDGRVDGREIDAETVEAGSS